jgi:cellulose biosynthesis protein BcsQ
LEKVAASQSPDLILIDLAGSYERAITVAMARAHLTIIPAAPSEADLFEATRVANHLRQVFGAFNREPLYRLLLTQVQSLASHAQTHAFREIERLSIPRFQAVLSHRAAYQEIGLSGCPPHLSDTSRLTITKAIAEIDAWLDETMTLIASTSQGKSAA